MSEEKWTKEQIETAKNICKESCSRISCEQCSLYKNDGCIIRKAIGLCPTLLEIEYTEGCEEKLKFLIQQHEHDADDVVECKLHMTGPTKEEIAKAEKLAMSVNNQTGRDYWRYQFAGMAMQGLLSNGMETEDTIADNALIYADALIKKLEGKNAGK